MLKRYYDVLRRQPVDDRAPRGGAHGYGSFSILHERAVEIMAKLGAVPVSPRNMMKLLKAGKAVLLYPGGVKEALHQKVPYSCGDQ